MSHGRIEHIHAHGVTAHGGSVRTAVGSRVVPGAMACCDETVASHLAAGGTLLDLAGLVGKRFQKKRTDPWPIAGAGLRRNDCCNCWAGAKAHRKRPRARQATRCVVWECRSSAQGMRAVLLDRQERDCCVSITHQCVVTFCLECA